MSENQNNDNRSPLTHVIHAVGHDINALMKDYNLGSLDNNSIYAGTDKTWSSDVDRKRSDYHWGQAAKKQGEWVQNVNQYGNGFGVNPSLPYTIKPNVKPPSSSSTQTTVPNTPKAVIKK